MLDAWLTPDRRHSLVNGTVGLGAGWLVLALLIWIHGAPAIMGGVAWALLVPGCVVFFFSLAVMAVRTHARAFDPVNADDPYAVRVTARTLTNTVEQGAVLATSTVVIALMSGPGVRQMVPALGVTFLLARLAFWLGYLTKPQHRAVGMGATLAVNAVAVATAIAVA